MSPLAGTVTPAIETPLAFTCVRKNTSENTTLLAEIDPFCHHSIVQSMLAGIVIVDWISTY